MSEPAVTSSSESARQPEFAIERSEPARVRPSVLVLGGLAVLVAGLLLGWFLRPLTESAAALEVPAADSVDVGFAQDMTVHHNQAVEMAAIELANGSDDRVRSLAYDILTSQQNQIGQMQGWLALWNRAAVPVDGYMRWMDHTDDDMGDMAGMDHSTHTESSDATDSGSTTMPGMATAEQMTQLRSATGVDVDRIFLDLMMTHHRGGVPMMEQAQQRAENPAVRRLAESMLQTQNSELELMASLRSQLG